MPSFWVSFCRVLISIRHRDLTLQILFEQISEGIALHLRCVQATRSPKEHRAASLLELCTSEQTGNLLVSDRSSRRIQDREACDQKQSQYVGMWLQLPCLRKKEWQRGNGTSEKICNVTNDQWASSVIKAQDANIKSFQVADKFNNKLFLNA